MAKIAEGVYFVPGQDEMIPDSHLYCLGEPSSHDLSLVDVGLFGKAGYKIQSLQEMGIELEDIKRIILTHTHFDHVGCLSEIQKKVPGAELWVHTLEANALEQGDERTVYGMEVFREMCQMQYGLASGAFTFHVHRKLQGGENVAIGGTDWQVLHIPGHSMGGIALYQRSKKILIPGDVLYADYAIGRYDLHGANAPELKKSLLKLSELDVDTLLPGHNRIVKNLPKGYISKTAKQWESYLTA